ncbi:MAG: hypothetical protein PF440_08655 [Thiomicrorhabdus sp.]|jgi:hypothetical protein|nr:hypothetical protein [Thiomicrorhabdus sp.]
MKKIYGVLNVFMWVLVLPLFILYSPIRWYRYIRGYEKRLYYFLTFGRALIGGYHGKLKVGTRKDNVIYETDDFDTWGNTFKQKDNEGRNIKTLLKMKVYDYWLEDDYLFVKVFRNDKLLSKFKGKNKENSDE